jgi:hypothetical protein
MGQIGPWTMEIKDKYGFFFFVLEINDKTWAIKATLKPCFTCGRFRGLESKHFEEAERVVLSKTKFTSIEWVDWQEWLQTTRRYDQ